MGICPGRMIRYTAGGIFDALEAVLQDRHTDLFHRQHDRIFLPDICLPLVTEVLQVNTCLPDIRAGAQDRPPEDPFVRKGYHEKGCDPVLEQDPQQYDNELSEKG